MDIIELHKLSKHNRKQVERAMHCFCFSCTSIFPVAGYIDGYVLNERGSSIKWVDGGTTALCPICSIDSVVPIEASNSLLINGFKGLYSYMNDICLMSLYYSGVRQEPDTKKYQELYSKRKSGPKQLVAYNNMIWAPRNCVPTRLRKRLKEFLLWKAANEPVVAKQSSKRSRTPSRKSVKLPRKLDQ